MRYCSQKNATTHAGRGHHKSAKQRPVYGPVQHTGRRTGVCGQGLPPAFDYSVSTHLDSFIPMQSPSLANEPDAAIAMPDYKRCFAAISGYPRKNCTSLVRLRANLVTMSWCVLQAKRAYLCVCPAQPLIIKPGQVHEHPGQHSL